MKYLVDASFVLKAILMEDDKVAVYFNKILRRVKSGNVEIFSHKLLISEVANGIKYSEKDKFKGLKYFRVFLHLPIHFLTLSKTQYKKVLEVSYDLNTTVYDTSYHILAKAHNATFLTCDEEYYKKGVVLGDIEYIK